MISVYYEEPKRDEYGQIIPEPTKDSVPPEPIPSSSQNVNQVSGRFEVMLIHNLRSSLLC